MPQLELDEKIDREEFNPVPSVVMANGEVIKNTRSRITVEKFVTDPSFSQDLSGEPFEDDKAWFANQE